MSKAQKWSWVLAFNAAHPYMTLAQVTGCAVAAGILSPSERAALVGACS